VNGPLARLSCYWVDGIIYFRVFLRAREEEREKGRRKERGKRGKREYMI
jgi:hypothetical protein